jgi:anti-sigma factor RsiW
VSDHAAVEELLGAYALDAVEPEEAALVEAHLETCPRCAEEVARHHEVAGLLANSGGTAPAGLWDGIAEKLGSEGLPDWEAIADRLDEPGPAGRPEPSGADPTVVPLGSARRSRTRAALGTRATAVVAAAAVVVAVVLGVQVAHLHGQVGSTSLSAAEARALASPTSRRIVLTGADVSPVTVVLTPSGTGFVQADGLPRLPADRTYQLWGVVGTTTVSLGLLGDRPGVRAFSLSGNAAVHAFAITDEQAGGVVRTVHRPVVAATVAD